MAEFAMFSVASKLLITIASPTFKKAYKKGRSIWEAKEDLDKIRKTIQTIQFVLLDAEKKQEGSDAVKDWIKRVKDVLYYADDLFDEVSTDDMLRKRSKGNKILKKVNPFVSNFSIAKEVKAIRESLDGIYKDMATFKFVECQNENEPICDLRKGDDPGSFVDSKTVFGREKDRAILDMFLDKPNSIAEEGVSVIAIVGIGGIGKTTLAQLVYNDEEVKRKFEKRWFASISDMFDDKKIIGKIFQSIHGKNYEDLTVGQQQSKIMELLKGKFLLVLDDVWDEDRGKWQDRMSLLKKSAEGSKIIVTTRSLSVAMAVDAFNEPHVLCGLSEDESWGLFKRIAFTPTRENDPRWTNLGREIVKKCANIPLAIKSIGGLLYTKTTIQEWESFKDEELSKVEVRNGGSIMHALKLSYKHLPSTDLKHCFAYCSLFLKGYNFDKMRLIYLWNAQGYLNPYNEKKTAEEVGHSYFMELLRRCFFQEEQIDVTGEVVACKMHDLIHDLAQQVAGEETIMFTESYDKFKRYTRHISVGHAKDDSWETPASLLSVNRLRSFLYMDKYPCKMALDQQFVKFKFLRALSLKWLPIENLSSSVGELKHLRFLDISHNALLKQLPNSITKLMNLQTLDLRLCLHLQALPNEFRKLINLRSLNIEGCELLKHMPLGFGELTLLQHLDEFKVGRGPNGGQTSKINAVVGLSLKGTLGIYFEDDTYDWDVGVECWKPPVTLQGLRVVGYKGEKIPPWVNVKTNSLPNLTLVHLSHCSRVKCLPPLRHLPYLKDLSLSFMDEFEYVEEDDENEVNLSPISIGKLQFLKLPKLKGWSRKIEANRVLSFPFLSTLSIDDCRQLESMPLSSPLFHTLTLHSVHANVIPHLISLPHSSSLEFVSIWFCDGLTSFHGESLTSLRHLSICQCNELKEVKFAPSRLNILEHFFAVGCRELELWEVSKRGVDWDSLPNLLSVFVDEIPSKESLPDCLQQRQALGTLQINCLRTLIPPPPPQT